MKKYLLSLLISFCVLQSFGAHIKGGFFTYQYLGPGIVDPTKLRYKITLTVYSSPNPSVGAPPGAQIWNAIDFTIFNGATTTQYANVNVALTKQTQLIKTYASPCITGDPSTLTGAYYSVFTYELNNYELPVSPDGYTVSYQKCCRLNGMDNLSNSGAVGNTWSIQIPGSVNPIANGDHNSSPIFPVDDTLLVCANNFFTYSFAGTDLDGDSLSYSFCYAYPGGDQVNVNPDPATPPPYASVPYLAPYTGTQPLGTAVRINSRTGIISGIAPPISNTGEYVVTVCVSEFRQGQYFAQSRKELHIRVRDCSPLSAKLKPRQTTCDGFTINFSNEFENQNPANTDYLWTFGDPSTGILDTSILANPVHTYSDTGVFKLIVRVSIAGQCLDTDTVLVRVYPGFFPGFIANAPLCKNVPVQFVDTTKTKYGFVDTWSWDFGNPVTLADTSHLQNPNYTYPSAGTYPIQFIVSNSKGCVDTIYQNIDVLDKPPLTVFPKDTSYCGLDTLQLTANGTGNFTWTPNYNIIGANTNIPQVYPAVTTKYYVKLDYSGCIANDSVIIRPVNDLTASIAATASNICEADTLTLTGTANHSPVTWQWNNVNSLSAPTSSITKAYPATTTNYVLTAVWGNHCIVAPNKTITVKPLAIPNAGPDKNICAGQSTAQLNASGGDTYIWSPVAGLSNPAISNPVANPVDTTTYIVSVGVNGCSTLRNDTVLVFVNKKPSLNVTNDTLICTIDTLQLTGNGTGNFVWSPNYMINNVNAQNPLVSPDVPTKYFVTLTDGNGCINKDSVLVDVKPFVTLNAGPDTSVCKTDGFLINTVGDALHYIWSPSTYLDDPTKKSPFTLPLANITYHVIANIGKCQAQDDISIKVVPYPPAKAGVDTIVCFGDNAQLNATGGTNYVWFPATFLNNRFIPNPVSVKPTANIQYIVTVTDTLGCPKPAKDTVWVRVYPKVIANAGPRDTSVVEGQPLQLTGTGGSIYLWSPSTYLTSTVIATPISTPLNTIEYALLVKTAAGCEGRDTILVKVFKIEAGIYVPNAFTPNGDGLNDVLRPVLLGIKTLTYFKVFNRWGQMVFSTSDQGRGWDGNFGGRGQDAATFVWEAEAVDYKNNIIRRKGYAVLVR
ncbi:MAG: PKD domain-containing protein [Ferruginibacter sp.]